MIGFTFKGKHSSSFQIGFQSIDRTSLPKRRVSEIIIPGRSGSIEVSSGEYEKRRILAIIGIMHEKNFESFREKIREIAFWLSGTGKLIFDDEPDKYYEATVYGAVDMNQLIMKPKGTMRIEFGCQPFAFSVDKKSKTLSNGHNRNLNYQGTAETPTRIIIRNTGTETIRNIKITQIRKGD